LTILGDEVKGFTTGPLPMGCSLCFAGLKAVIFITGVCDEDCYYCPIDMSRWGRPVIYVNEERAADLDSVIAEVQRQGAKGASITGGDPLADLPLVLRLVRSLKYVMGDGHFELHLSGGRNILIKVEDPKKGGQLPYRPLDSLLLSIPGSQVKDHVEFKVGNMALVVWGRNMGRYGKIVSVTRGWGWERSIVALEDPAGNKFETSLSYVYVVGRDKPLITVTG